MHDNKETVTYRQPEALPHSQPSTTLTSSYSDMELFLLTEDELTARRTLSMIELRPPGSLKDRS